MGFQERTGAHLLPSAQCGTWTNPFAARPLQQLHQRTLIIEFLVANSLKGAGGFATPRKITQKTPPKNHTPQHTTPPRVNKMYTKLTYCRSNTFQKVRLGRCVFFAVYARVENSAGAVGGPQIKYEKLFPPPSRQQNRRGPNTFKKRCERKNACRQR